VVSAIRSSYASKRKVMGDLENFLTVPWDEARFAEHTHTPTTSLSVHAKHFSKTPTSNHVVFGNIFSF
jgi:hypothetical protein